jgi:hypothetical protein
MKFDSVSKDEAIDSVRVMRDLPMETASHITQIRVDKMFQDAGISGQAPCLSDPVPLRWWTPKPYWSTSAFRNPWLRWDEATTTVGRKAYSPCSTSTFDTGKSNPITPAQQFKPRHEQQRQGFHSNNSQSEKRETSELHSRRTTQLITRSLVQIDGREGVPLNYFFSIQHPIFLSNFSGFKPTTPPVSKA